HHRHTTETSTLSLRDALPIFPLVQVLGEPHAGPGRAVQGLGPSEQFDGVGDAASDRPANASSRSRCCSRSGTVALPAAGLPLSRSEEHTPELHSPYVLGCRLP